jgi:hypothetical protein
MAHDVVGGGVILCVGVQRQDVVLRGPLELGRMDGPDRDPSGRHAEGQREQSCRAKNWFQHADSCLGWLTFHSRQQTGQAQGRKPRVYAVSKGMSGWDDGLWFLMSTHCAQTFFETLYDLDPDPIGQCAGC